MTKTVLMVDGTVMGFQVPGLGAGWCVESGSNYSTRDTGLPDALEDNGRGSSILYGGDANVSELQTPLSNF